jgi:transposase
MYSIGLDISKSTINVYIPINDVDLIIENSVSGLKKLYSKLQKFYKKDIDNLVYVFEPTANYSYTLMKHCSQKNIKCFVVNPKRSSNFAKVIGHRNKTDIDDARLLSKMIVTANDEDIKIPKVDTVIDDLKELISLYKLIIKQQTQNRNHIDSLKTKKDNSYAIKELELQYKFLKKQEDKIVKQIKKIITLNKNLNQSFQNIQTIQGVGEISAIILLNHFIQYPNANQKQIISLAGLDPIERSSGTTINGKPKISKAGSKICRGTLFMPTLATIRYNERLKRFYNRLKDNGKHTTVAQIAVMRKIIVIAYSLHKNNATYDPQRLC